MEGDFRNGGLFGSHLWNIFVIKSESSVVSSGLFFNWVLILYLFIYFYFFEDWIHTNVGSKHFCFGSDDLVRKYTF